MVSSMPLPVSETRHYDYLFLLIAMLIEWLHREENE